MNNPNESILLTEDGHPIGEVVIADHTSVEPGPEGPSASEARDIALRAAAAELTGNPDEDGAVAELYPHYLDAEKRHLAMIAYVTQGASVPEVALKVGVPERTVSMWAYNCGWDNLLKQELAARQSQSVMELTRIRTDRRTKMVNEQLTQAKKLRDTAMKRLDSGDVGLKSATEAWAAAAKVEHTLAGLSEAGTIANIDGEDSEKKKKDAESKQPLVVVVNGGGLLPVRKASIDV